MITLSSEFRKAYSGDAWHGNNLSSIVSSVPYNNAYRRPIPNAHTIAELVLHITAWTEEVISRLMDNVSKDPDQGDWPVVEEESSEAWDVILSEFQIANEKLNNLAMMITDEQWLENVSRPTDVKQAKWELLNGLIQHHAYHGGQISLLLKF